MARLFSLWRNLVNRAHVDRDLDEELHETLELLVDEKVRLGMYPDDARRAARIDLGSVESSRHGICHLRACRVPAVFFGLATALAASHLDSQAVLRDEHVE
jgi:hypothetical protein